MTLHVRRIRPDEGAALKALRLLALADAPDAFAQTLDEVQRSTDSDWAAKAHRWATSLTDASFFAVRDADIVGMGGVFIDCGHGELVAMWTRPHARCEGVAHQIIEAVVEWCHAGGLAELWAGVADGNRRAAALYESAAFEPTGRVRPLRRDGRGRELRYRRALP
jgi:RimJ/RimL family protein N-acetyltransferase